MTRLRAHCSHRNGMSIGASVGLLLLSLNFIIASATGSAAQTKNVDGLWNVGERIDLVCENCHREYAYEDAPRRKR